MTHLIQFLFSLIASSAQTRLSLQIEVAALRHQLSLLKGAKMLSGCKQACNFDPL